MDDDFHSKRPHPALVQRASFDSPCSLTPEPGLFRITEISGKGLAGNSIPIVHTGFLH
jgi:hypothetical protein